MPRKRPVNQSSHSAPRSLAPDQVAQDTAQGGPFGRVLTEAEKAEMEANPLPVTGATSQLAPSGETEQVPPPAEEVQAAQDKAYPVLSDADITAGTELGRAILAIDPAQNHESANAYLMTQQSTFMQGVLKCHTCGRTGDEDLAECPNLSLPNYTCPTPTPIDPDTDVVLHSASLGIIRTVPVESLVRGHAQRYLAGCHSDDCGYKVLHPKGA